MSIYGDEYGKIEFEILAILYRVFFLDSSDLQP